MESAGNADGLFSENSAGEVCFSFGREFASWRADCVFGVGFTREGNREMIVQSK